VPESPKTAKTDLRTHLRSARRRMPAEVRAAADTTLIAALIDLVLAMSARAIASYFPLPSEPGGNRLVITGFGSLATHALFATIDLNTGALALDRRQIDFDRQWPDGWNGPAMPHGAVFGHAAAATR